MVDSSDLRHADQINDVPRVPSAWAHLNPSTAEPSGRYFMIIEPTVYDKWSSQLVDSTHIRMPVVRL